MAGLRALVCAAAIGAAGRTHAVYVKPTMGGAVRYVAEQDIERPTGAFPGATVADTNADWPSGKQPENLQYWPQAAFDTEHRIMLPCYLTYVAEDTAAGWAGQCKNLMRNKMINTLETCKSFCRLEPRCAIWQFVNQTNPGQCWVGYGTHCAAEWGRVDGISVQAAQRLQHGDVKVLAYLQGVKIKNLWNLPLATIDPAQGQKQCKEWCYSDIACQYWQYHPREGGCYVEARLFSTNQGQNQDKVVAYPLALDSGAEANPQWQIGEYIAHYCPPEVQSPVTQAPSAPLPVSPMPPYPTHAAQGGFPWAWIAASIAILLLCAGAAWYVYQQNQQKGSSDDRASPQRGGGGQRSAKTGGGGRSQRQQPPQFDDYDGPSYKSNDEGRPLIPDGGATPASEALNGGYGYDQQQRGNSRGGTSRSSSQQQFGQQQQPQYSSERQGQSSAPYTGQGQYGQGGAQGGAGGGYGGQGGGSSSQYGGGCGGGQAGQPPGGGGGYNQGQGSTMMPPPTQLVDFGQNPGRMAPTQLFQNQAGGAGGAGGMAPTQLLNQGMPFPPSTPGHPGMYGQRPQGMY